MFRKKSLKVKLSLILIGMVLLISVSSVLLSNIFLKRFYLAKKNQTLISTFEKIDDMYAVELQGKTTESGESGSTDEGLESYVIPDSGISDELYLQLDKLSQTRNLSVIIYRDMSSPIFDYMLKSNTKLLLYSSLGMNQNSKVESSNIYSDYINADYEIEKVNVKRLGASYIYLVGTFKNGDHIFDPCLFLKHYRKCGTVEPVFPVYFPGCRAYRVCGDVFCQQSLSGSDHCTDEYCKANV